MLRVGLSDLHYRTLDLPHGCYIYYDSINTIALVFHLGSIDHRGDLYWMDVSIKLVGLLII